MYISVQEGLDPSAICSVMLVWALDKCLYFFKFRAFESCVRVLGKSLV